MSESFITTPILEYVEAQALSWNAFARRARLTNYKVRQYASGARLPDTADMERISLATNGAISDLVWAAVSRLRLEHGIPTVRGWAADSRIEAHTAKHRKRNRGAPVAPSKPLARNTPDPIPRRTATISLEEIASMPEQAPQITVEATRSKTLSVSLSAWIVWLLRDKASKANRTVSGYLRTLLEGWAMASVGDAVQVARLIADLQAEHGGTDEARTGSGRAPSPSTGQVPLSLASVPDAATAQTEPDTPQASSRDLEAELKAQEAETGVSLEELKAFVQAKRDQSVDPEPIVGTDVGAGVDVDVGADVDVDVAVDVGADTESEVGT